MASCAGRGCCGRHGTAHSRGVIVSARDAFQLPGVERLVEVQPRHARVTKYPGRPHEELRTDH
jgi:hypothetical protein